MGRMERREAHGVRLDLREAILVEHLHIGHPVRLGLLEDLAESLELDRVGGDDDLAARVVGHGVRLGELLQQVDAATAQARLEAARL